MKTLMSTRSGRTEAKGAAGFFSSRAAYLSGQCNAYVVKRRIVRLSGRDTAFGGMPAGAFVGVIE